MTASRIRSTVLVLVLAAVPAVPCAAAADPLLAPGKLPPPPRSGGTSLVEALWARRSVRSFADTPLTREQLAFILWAADGVNRPAEGKRTAPSAWGSNAVSIFAVTKDGAAVYDAAEHALVAVDAAKGKDVRERLAGAEFTRKAPLVLVLAADFSRYGEKGSKEMREQIVHADCGVILQNICLAAAALDLGTVVTADSKPEAKGALGLGESWKTLYSMPVGHPSEPQGGGAPAKPAGGK